MRPLQKDLVNLIAFSEERSCTFSVREQRVFFFVNTACIKGNMPLSWQRNMHYRNVIWAVIKTYSEKDSFWSGQIGPVTYTHLVFDSSPTHLSDSQVHIQVYIPAINHVCFSDKIPCMAHKDKGACTFPERYCKSINYSKFVIRNNSLNYKLNTGCKSL